MVAVTNLQAPKPIKNMVPQSGDEILKALVSIVQLESISFAFTLIAGSPTFSRRKANSWTGLFCEFETWWCISNEGGASTCDWLPVGGVGPPASATRRNTRLLCSCLANCAGVSNLLVSG